MLIESRFLKKNISKFIGRFALNVRLTNKVNDLISFGVKSKAKITNAMYGSQVPCDAVGNIKIVLPFM
jgi:hypothetical protein